MDWINFPKIIIIIIITNNNNNNNNNNNKMKNNKMRKLVRSAFLLSCSISFIVVVFDK